VPDKTGVAIIGCGNIAGPYARDLATYEEIDLRGMTDLDRTRAEALAGEYGGQIYPSIEALLADPTVDIVVNLTIHHAHKAVTTQCLDAGKHVFSEKPLALSYAEAQGLVELAAQRGVRLGCAPFTYMGEAQQTAWKQIREGRLGTVRLAYAEVNWGRIETWHPNPAPFYDVGVLYDVGVYPLTLLTTIFGPVHRVRAYGTVLYPDRVTTEGVPFHIETPDYMLATVEWPHGLVVRLTTNFYVNFHSKQTGVEFHGDGGSLYLSSWADFHATVETTPFGEPYNGALPLLQTPYEGTEWGRGIREMAEAFIEDRPHRATGAQAAHVVEIIEAATCSIQNGTPVEIHSTFTPPAPMDWAV
jgi:predicted dehydrogenase